MEQTRLLNWGEKIGLVEQLFDQPSKTLQLDRNLVCDILLEIQALFRSCVKVMEKHDENILPMQAASKVIPSADRRFPKGTNSILMKVLSVTEKAPELGGRLQWAMVKQDTFKGIVEKLIGYNNAVEALLDSNSIDQLQRMQHQTYMVMLQLNGKVDELKQMSLAMQVKTQPTTPGSANRLSRATTLVADQEKENASFVCLAEFKAHQKLIEQDGSSMVLKPISSEQLQFLSSKTTRAQALYQSKQVWIEWKAYATENRHPPWWDRMVEDRIKQLATLLGSSQKPKEFRAPQCLGYTQLVTEDKRGFGFVYEWPNNLPSKPMAPLSEQTPSNSPPKTTITSLFDLFKTKKMPSLTERRQLALAITQSLMYLHSVNWLHKGIRSNNIVFFHPPDSSTSILQEPILSGFEYARPDLTGEWTEPTPKYSEDDIYKHPQTLGGARLRSKKSDDVYSLGIVLVEIAHWRSIADILCVPQDSRAARAMVRGARDMLLEPSFLEDIEGLVGQMWKEAVRKCLVGGQELGLVKNADETDPEVGASLHEAYSEEVVGRISGMRV